MDPNESKKEGCASTTGKMLDTALERQQILETVINNSPVIVFQWKAEGTENEQWPVEFVSENVILLGYSVEDFTSGRLSYADIVYPDDLGQVQNELNKRRREGSDYFDQEYRIVLGSKDVRWVNERTYIQRNEKDEVTHYQGTIFDITDQKNNEIALHEAHKREMYLNTIINNSPVMVFLWRAEEFWPADYASENVERLGYTAEDFVLGRIVYGDLVHPDDLEMVKKELARRCDSGYDDFSQQYRIITRSGNVHWVEERTFIQRNDAGKVTHYQGIILDITEHKRSEMALEEAEKRQAELLTRQKALETIINSGPVVAFLWKAGAEGEEELWPAEFVSDNVTQFGYTVEDFTSGRVQYGDIVHPDDLPDVQIELSETCKEGGTSFIKEYRILTKAGDVCWVEEKTFIQRDKTGVVTHYQGVIQDITERKEKGC
ncbi:MAG: PAS domain-containing protein [Methanosarcinaceae archaeon]|nr:PAS domain-containing protein [Methanosarcinaceae archaeon]